MSEQIPNEWDSIQRELLDPEDWGAHSGAYDHVWYNKNAKYGTYKLPKWQILWFEYIRLHEPELLKDTSKDEINREALSSMNTKAKNHIEDQEVFGKGEKGHGTGAYLRKKVKDMEAYWEELTRSQTHEETEAGLSPLSEARQKEEMKKFEDKEKKVNKIMDTIKSYQNVPANREKLILDFLNRVCDYGSNFEYRDHLYTYAQNIEEVTKKPKRLFDNVWIPCEAYFEYFVGLYGDSPHELKQWTGTDAYNYWMEYRKQSQEKKKAQNLKKGIDATPPMPLCKSVKDALRHVGVLTYHLQSWNTAFSSPRQQAKGVNYKVDLIMPTEFYKVSIRNNILKCKMYKTGIKITDAQGEFLPKEEIDRRYKAWMNAKPNWLGLNISSTLPPCFYGYAFNILAGSGVRIGGSGHAEDWNGFRKLRWENFYVDLGESRPDFKGICGFSFMIDKGKLQENFDITTLPDFKEDEKWKLFKFDKPLKLPYKTVGKRWNNIRILPEARDYLIEFGRFCEDHLGYTQFYKYQNVSESNKNLWYYDRSDNLERLKNALTNKQIKNLQGCTEFGFICNISYEVFKRSMVQIFRENGITKRITPHMFRKCFVERLYHQGMALEKIASIAVGWKDLETLIAHYLMKNEEKLNEAWFGVIDAERNERTLLETQPEEIINKAIETETEAKEKAMREAQAVYQEAQEAGDETEENEPEEAPKGKKKGKKKKKETESEGEND